MITAPAPLCHECGSSMERVANTLRCPKCRAQSPELYHCYFCGAVVRQADVVEVTRADRTAYAHRSCFEQTVVTIPTPNIVAPVEPPRIKTGLESHERCQCPCDGHSCNSCAAGAMLIGGRWYWSRDAEQAWKKRIGATQ